MAVFNPMSSLAGGTTASATDALGLTGGMDPSFDGDMGYDENILDSINGALPPLPFTPTYDFDSFSTFEDPFSYPATVRPFDTTALSKSDHHLIHHSHSHSHLETLNDAGDEPSSAQELDNKLLGFSAPILKATVLQGETGQLAEVGMTAELYGMFFVAEDVFGADANPNRPLELTCYRRNLWQCSGQITLPKQVSQVMDEQGRQVPVVDLAASITAIESIEGKTTEIISIPWKSANPPTTTGGANVPAAEEVKVAAGSPANIPLDLSGAQEVDASRVSVPVAWKRLQFKHATANNGRRKGLQQHYVVQINLLAKTAQTSEYIKIAEIQSGPVIVRGRSPRNFDSRKDVPLTSSGTSLSEKKLNERRSTSARSPPTASTTASSSNGNGGPVADAGPVPKVEKTESSSLVQNLQRYHSLGNVAQPYGQPAQHGAKKVAMTSPNLTRPPVPSWSNTNSDGALMKTPHRPSTSSAVAINLSLSEDERSPNRSSSDMQSPQFSKTSMVQDTTGQSPMETADMLYEYFPLSLDDWSPPEDALYRPHAAHHVPMLPEVKAQQVRSKAKRYFVDE